MRTRIVTVALAVASGAAVSPALAQQALSLEFNDGRVRLIADNVPVSQILAEWSRRGGTQIVNGERVPGPPVTLQLVDVPERQALDIVLRGAAGYMVSAREAAAPAGSSSFDKVLVMPTTSRAPAAAVVQPPPPPQPQFQLPESDEPPQVEEPQPEPGPGQESDEPQSVPGFQRGRVPAGLNLPNTPPEEVEPEEDVPDPDVPAASPGNPFGIPAGSNRPGVINRPSPQQGPDTQQPDR